MGVGGLPSCLRTYAAGVAVGSMASTGGGQELPAPGVVLRQRAAATLCPTASLACRGTVEVPMALGIPAARYRDNEWRVVLGCAAAAPSPREHTRA